MDRYEAAALAEYQLAVQALIAGADPQKVTPLSLAEARKRLDDFLVGEEPSRSIRSDRDELHRILGVA